MFFTASMSSRSWLAVLLLINYLLVVGTGCMSRPEDQRGFVMVQTTEAGHDYQACCYLRMDGLENFLAEALASRYQNAPDATPKHHILSVVLGIDAHCLPQAVWALPTVACRQTVSSAIGYVPRFPADVYHSVSAPPWS